jgi:plasmid stabilization system protein ParE
MSHRVVVTEEAKRNLRAAYLWAAERAPETALRWLSRFESELQSLSRNPKRCPRAPEDGLVAAEIRQFIFGRRSGAFRVLFTVVEHEVRILHIRRAARDWADAADLGVE